MATKTQLFLCDLHKHSCIFDGHNVMSFRVTMSLPSSPSLSTTGSCLAWHCLPSSTSLNPTSQNFCRGRETRDTQLDMVWDSGQSSKVKPVTPSLLRLGELKSMENITKSSIRSFLSTCWPSTVHIFESVYCDMTRLFQRKLSCWSPVIFRP